LRGCGELGGLSPRLSGSSGKLLHFRAVASWRSPDATATTARAERGGADGG
jgi:hypothetical protein